MRKRKARVRADLNRSSLLWDRERGIDPSKSKINPFTQRSLWKDGISPNGHAILKLYDNSGVTRFNNARFFRMCQLAQMSEMDMMVMIGVTSQRHAARIWDANSWPLAVQISANHVEAQLNALLNACGMKVSGRDMVLAKWVELVKKSIKG